mmetsp:Transcript_655/g.1009  ORF Transcript_655/g.1009 Transcript_655/m.1009 type:complete len:236 (+) Transcript_655:196-903(+)
MGNKLVWPLRARKVVAVRDQGIELFFRREVHHLDGHGGRGIHRENADGSGRVILGIARTHDAASGVFGAIAFYHGPHRSIEINPGDVHLLLFIVSVDFPNLLGGDIFDPRHDALNFAVNPWEVGIGTSLSPRGDAPQHVASLLPAAQGPAAIALAGVHDALLGDAAGTEHGAADHLLGVAVVLFTNRVRQQGDCGFLQNIWCGAHAFQGSPASDAAVRPRLLILVGQTRQTNALV